MCYNLDTEGFNIYHCFEDTDTKCFVFNLFQIQIYIMKKSLIITETWFISLIFIIRETKREKNIVLICEKLFIIVYGIYGITYTKLYMVD